MTSSKNRYWPTGGDKPVPSITIAGAKFVIEHSRLLDFVAFFSDAGSKRRHALIEKIPSAVASFGQVDEVMKETRKYFQDLDSHDELLNQVILTRVVDNFLCYITDLLALIYEARPEMLKSSEQERLDFIFQYSNMAELRTAVAEKRVERLAYLGLRELAEYIKAHMGFDLFPQAVDIEKAALIVEYRNIMVHNRGQIGSATIRRFPILKPQLGKRVILSHDSLRDDRKFLENAVIDIDLRATSKFSLKAAPLREPPANL